MSALVDDADRPFEPSSGASADATLDGASLESAAADVAADRADDGTSDGASADEAADGGSRNGRAHTGAGSASDGVAQDAAVTGSTDHEDAGPTAIVADATAAGDPVPDSSGAQVVQDAPAPTRAELRIDFGAHLEANYRRLVAQLYAITLDPAEAHSAVQDAYSRAWRTWATVSRTPDPAGWVRRVAVRSTMRSWRRLRLRSRRPVGPGPDTSVGAVLAALRRLPPSERRCVVLHHMAGAPLPEIAAVEGISVGTTAARLARAQQVVSAGLVDVLSHVLGPEPHSLDGWAAPEWDAPRLTPTGASDDEEDQR